MALPIEIERPLSGDFVPVTAGACGNYKGTPGATGSSPPPPPAPAQKPEDPGVKPVEKEKPIAVKQVQKIGATVSYGTGAAATTVPVNANKITMTGSGKGGTWTISDFSGMGLETKTGCKLKVTAMYDAGADTTDEVVNITFVAGQVIIAEA